MRRSHKQNGTEAETKVARYLLKWFPGVRRLPSAGVLDEGDLGGIPDLTVQVKQWHKQALAQWVDEAATQASRSNCTYYVVVHKRWGKGNPGEWYATLPLEVFAEVYAKALASGVVTTLGTGPVVQGRLVGCPSPPPGSSISAVGDIGTTAV